MKNIKKLNINKSWSYSNVIFGLILFVTSVVIYVPLELKLPSDGLDPSWIYGMNTTVSEGWRIGERVIFTFGPYASVITKTFHPDLYRMTMIASLYLASAFFLVAYLVFRAAWVWTKISFLVALWSIYYFPDTLFYLYFLIFFIYVYRDIAACRAYTWCDAVILLICISALGMIALVKGSLLIGCIATIAFSSVILAIKGYYKRIVLIIVTPCVSVVVFWFASGQELSALPQYFAALIPIVQGYTEAMSTVGPINEIIYYITASLFILTVLYMFLDEELWSRLVFIAIFSLVLFLVFKSGFVRHDAHALIACSTFFLISILVSTQIPKRASIIVIIIGLFVWYSIAKNYTYLASVNMWGNASERYDSTVRGLQTQIAGYSFFENHYSNAIKNLKQRGEILDLPGTVDIYSYDQSYLIASGNKWNPRPIFQSYSAYTKELLEKNKNHLLGENGPDYIIFKMQPIDGRLPALEEGVSWPVILANYEPLKLLNKSLYLKRRTDAVSNFNFTTYIGGGVYRVGEVIALPDVNGLIFAKIKLKKTAGGAVLNTLFKPSQLEIKLIMVDDNVKIFRMVPAMAESGAIISPLVQTAGEFGLLYGETKNINNLKVKSIQINAPNYPFMWRDMFEIEFSSVNYKMSPKAVEVLGFVEPYTDESREVVKAEVCMGSVDYINGKNEQSMPIVVSAYLKTYGWLATSTSPPVVPNSIYLVLTDTNGKRRYLNAKSSNRSDVGSYFMQPLLNSSGYELEANVSSLKGNYSVGLAYSNEHNVFLCPQFNIPIEIN